MGSSLASSTCALSLTFMPPTVAPREKEVSMFLAQGRTGTYIQEQLVLSQSTVRTHEKHLSQAEYGRLSGNARPHPADEAVNGVSWSGVTALRHGVAVLWCLEFDIAFGSSGLSASKNATIRQFRGAPQILEKTPRGEIETTCPKRQSIGPWRTWTRGVWFEVLGARFKMWDVASARGMRALAGWKRERRRDGDFEVSRSRTTQCPLWLRRTLSIGVLRKRPQVKVS